MNFEGLKNRDADSKAAGLKQLVKAGLDQKRDDREPVSAFHYNKEKIKEALLCEGVDAPELLGKIERCGVKGNKVCGNIWCLKCRDAVSSKMKRKVSGYISDVEKRRSGRSIRNNELCMITGVMGLCDFNAAAAIAQIKEDTNRWRRIRRRLEKIKEDKFIIAAYEFELVNWLFLRSSKKSAQKQKHISDLMKNSELQDRNVFLFAHFHGITNLRKSEIEYVFDQEYFIGTEKRKISNTMNSGLWEEEFHQDKLVQENVSKICSYPFKTVYRFKHSFEGSDYTNGDYLSKEELGNLISIYDEWVGRGYRRVFRSCSNMDELCTL